MDNNQQGKANEYHVDRPYVIICEGIDDKLFIDSYLKYLSSNQLMQYEQYNIMELSGLDNVKKEMKNYKRYSNYEYMKGFLFICDADKNANAAVDSMKDHIQRAWNIVLNGHGDFKRDSNGVSVGLYVMPGMDDNGNLRNGTLEDLCLDLLKLETEYNDAAQLTKDINDYIDKIQEIRIAQLKRIHKTRLHIALSSMNECVGAKIGEAAQRGAFDFSNDKLSRLKGMILSMQNTNTKEE